MQIQNIRPIAPIANDIGKSAAPSVGGFGDFLRKAMDSINETGTESTSDAISIMTGQSDAPHNILISSEEARITLELTLAVRTKALDAYNEIMRMQL